MEHKIKIRLKYFYNLYNNRKLFQIRKDNSNFQKGVQILLRAVNEKGQYTGSWISAVIIWVVDDPIHCKVGHVKLAIRVLQAEI